MRLQVVHFNGINPEFREDKGLQNTHFISNSKSSMVVKNPTNIADFIFLGGKLFESGNGSPNFVILTKFSNDGFVWKRLAIKPFKSVSDVASDK